MSNSVPTSSFVAAAGFAALCGLVGGSIILPRAHVDADRATFYVFRDDIVIFPISFSIPKDRILTRLPEKTAFAVNDSRYWQIKNYRYGPLEEEEYHLNLQRHRFGDTRRKGGYDCLRHYELLANGCVPILDGLEDVPPSLLTTLPRPLLARARELFELPWVGIEDGPGECLEAGPGAFDDLANELLNYTATHLTTEAAARYLLNSLDIPTEGSKVLFLPCSPFDNFPNFLTASVFHGLVSLLGDGVVDVPEYEYAYRYQNVDPAEEVRVRGSMWGQGYTLGFKLPRRPHLNRMNISQRIRSGEFDLIVFGRASPYEPCNFWYSYGGRDLTVPQFFEDVYGRYPRERVALLYGDDSGLDDAVVRTHASRMGALHRGLGYIFMRELLPFAGEGHVGEVLRPVDGSVLQPGCFYPEWLGFFERWLEPGGGGDGSAKGLRSCAVWGDCAEADISEYVASAYFRAQMPPLDTSAFKHFCHTGFALKAAVLVQWLGVHACALDADCVNACHVGLGGYSRKLWDAPADRFHAEFGVTPAELVFVLSHGCKAGAIVVQPAHALQRRGVAVLAERLPAGPLAGEPQLRYLINQAFTVLAVVGNATVEALATPSLPRYLGMGLMRLAPLRAREGPCAWKEAGQPLYYAHFDLGGDGAAGILPALACLAAADAEHWRPMFVSVQMPHGAVAGATVPVATRDAMSQLLMAGFRRFKVTRLAATSLGGPVGDLASDAATGPRWRTAAEVLVDKALLMGGQLHAAF